MEVRHSKQENVANRKESVTKFDKGSVKKSVSETRAPKEVGFLALCSGGKNMIIYSARKNCIFLPILQFFFLKKKLQI